MKLIPIVSLADLDPCYFEAISSIQRLPRFGIALAARISLSRPAPKQYFTPRCPVNCCASTHFGENQLAIGSSGISPLTTTHPLILQHQLAFTTTLVVFLNQAIAYESPTHSSIGTRLEPRAGLLPLLGSLRFHVLFHSSVEVLFILPSRYYFTISHPRVFNLARWSLLIHTGFHTCPMQLGSERWSHFARRYYRNRFCFLFL
ncbi:hypothetical protein S83_063875 [Arachis hypogaea]